MQKNAITSFATAIEICTRGPSQYKDVVLSVHGSHYKDKTVSQPSYLYNGIPYMKTWYGALGTQFAPVLYNHTTGIAMKGITWLSYVEVQMGTVSCSGAAAFHIAACLLYKQQWYGADGSW